MAHLGDLLEDQSIDFTFTTITAEGVPFTLAGSPVLSVYKSNSVTQTTTGPTLSVDFDGVTGLNHVRMATTDAFYVVATDYSVVITTGTVNSVSVVGYVVAQFSIENRNTKANLVSILGTALTETTGLIAAGFKKFFNVATPTGTINSIPGAVAGAAGGLFIAGANAATSVTTALTTNITGNITGNLSGSVGSVTGAVGSVTGAVGSVTGAVGSVTGNVGGNVTGSVGSVTGAVGSVTGAVGSVTGAVGSVGTGGIAAASLATAAVTKIWDAANFSGISTGRTVTITVKDTDGAGAAIDSVRVEIWDSAGTTTMYAIDLATDASGQSTFTLADGTYMHKLYKPGSYTFTDATFTVSAVATTFEWYGTPVSTSAPSAVTTALSGYAVDAAGSVAVGVQISVRSPVPNLHNTTNIVTDLKTTDTTDSNGYFSLTVMRNEPLLVTCSAMGLEDYPITCTAGTADLSTLITPKY